MENKIKEIRANTGLSQSKFGEAYHIPKRTVQDWESGRGTPPRLCRRSFGVQGAR
nr:MAG TPA: putative transcriptional regulator [Caudoviricetes sp.]